MGLCAATLIVAACGSGNKGARDTGVPAPSSDLGAVDLGAVDVEDAGSTGDAGVTDASAAMPYSWPDFGAVFGNIDGAASFSPEGCNTVAYGTAPGLGDVAVGRILNQDTAPRPGLCPSPDGGLMNVDSLSWVQLQWPSTKPAPQPVYEYRVLDTTKPVPVEDGTQMVRSAYDPNVVSFHGEYWTAFECSIENGTTSVCMGPLVPDASGQVTMDVARISVVVTGIKATSSAPARVATVPSLVVAGGQPYIYWGDATLDSGGSFAAEDQRGVALAVDAVTGRMYAAPSGASAPHAIVSNEGTLVMENAGWRQVIEYGGNIIATGTLSQPASDMGGRCASPADTVPYCFRVLFAQSPSPLGPFTIIPSEALAPTMGLDTIDGADGIPNVPGTYNKFVYHLNNQSNTAFMGGSFLSRWPTSLRQYSLAFEWPDDLFAAPKCPNANSDSNQFPSPIELNGSCVGTTLQRSVPAGQLTLAAGDCVLSGGAELCMKTAGNLVVYDANGNELWGTEQFQYLDLPSPSAGKNFALQPNGCASCTAEFHSDGRLALVDHGVDASTGDTYWSTTTTAAGASLSVSATNPHVSISSSADSSSGAAPGPPVFDEIAAGYELRADQCSTVGNVKLCMHEAGNLTLTLTDSTGTSLWDSQTWSANQTSGYSGLTTDRGTCTTCYASFQADGNLVLYDPTSTFGPTGSHAYWSSMTSHPGAKDLFLSLSGVSPHVAITDRTGALLTPTSW